MRQQPHPQLRLFQLSFSNLGFLMLLPASLQFDWWHWWLGELMVVPDLLQVTWEYNANLGRFTNFVNLLDMAGIAVPSGLLTGECT